MNIEQKLIELGGKIWENDAHRRIYLNDAILKIDTKRGFIGSVETSKTDARSASSDKNKYWYDCKTGNFDLKFYGNDYALNIVKGRLIELETELQN